MNTMGCSFLILAMAALIVGFIPILTWITLVVALPLSVIGVVSSWKPAMKPHAQSADKAMFWIAIGLVAMIALRLVTLS